jgi:hypothetical protein
LTPCRVQDLRGNVLLGAIYDGLDLASFFL